MPQRIPKQPCTVADCDSPQIARGWCRAHYLRWYRHGDLTNRQWAHRDPIERFRALVNESGPIPEWRPDLGPCHLWTGTISSSGYGLFSMGGRQTTIGAHVAVVLLAGEEIPVGHEVDHLCFVRPCVRRSHLEIVTSLENNRRMQAHRRMT